MSDDGTVYRPRRRFSGSILIGADTREELARALRSLAGDIERGCGLQAACGGYASGWTLQLVEDPDMDHDRYVAALDRYLEREPEPCPSPPSP